MISCFYEFYVTTVYILITDSENEDFDDSFKDKDWKEDKSSERSSESSKSECDDILTNDNINEQGVINDIINKVCESAILSEIEKAQEYIIPISQKSKKRVKNTTQWSRNVKKTKLNLGEEYINNSGKKVDQKQL